MEKMTTKTGIVLRIITLSSLLLSIVLVCTTVPGYSQNTFTGTFLADSRPYALKYLSIIQTGNVISGSLIKVTPNGTGGTQSNTLSLRGTTDRDAVSLTIDRLFGDLVINGRKQGVTVVLMFPTDSGSISSVVFRPTDENNYNLLLGQWQEELATIHKDKERLTKIANAEKERSTKLANALSDDINEVKSTGINRNLDDIKSALDDEKSAIHDLENNLAELRQDASLRPMTCYQANSKVDYDYNSRMAYSYDSRLGYAHDKFIASLKDLERRLSGVEAIVTEIKQEAHDLAQAIKESKYPRPELRVMPGEERLVLEQYQALAASARNELPSLKATHSDILNKAKKTMHEGEATLKTTQASVRCD